MLLLCFFCTSATFLLHFYYTSVILPLKRNCYIPWAEEPVVDSTNSAGHYYRLSKKHQRSPQIFPNTYTSKDHGKTNNRRTDQFTSIGQWKCAIHGIKPCRRLTWTPHADNDKRGIHVTHWFCVCATSQPRRLSKNHWNSPTTSACN